jgi:hypothetical protein
MNSAVRVSILLGSAALVGCASAQMPSEATGIALSPIPSQSVAVYQPKLVVKDGRLVLDGWVYRQFGSSTTTLTHLDVAFIDAAGRELRSEVTRFAPSALRFGSHKMAHRGHYTLPIAALPTGTASIQVRAHDSAEHQP